MFELFKAWWLDWLSMILSFIR